MSFASSFNCHFSSKLYASLIWKLEIRRPFLVRTSHNTLYYPILPDITLYYPILSLSNPLLCSGQSMMSVREPGTGSSIAHLAARCGDKAILKLLLRKYSDYTKMSNNNVSFHQDF